MPQTNPEHISTIIPRVLGQCYYKAVNQRPTGKSTGQTGHRR